MHRPARAQRRPSPLRGRELLEEAAQVHSLIGCRGAQGFRSTGSPLVGDARMTPPDGNPTTRARGKLIGRWIIVAHMASTVVDVLDVPVGSLFFALCTLMAIAPIRRPWPLAVLSFICGNVPNELPFVFLTIVVVPTAPTLRRRRPRLERLARPWPWPWRRCAGLVVVIGRGLRTGRSVDGALDQALGPGWRRNIDLVSQSANRVASTCRGYGSCSCRGRSGAATSSGWPNISYGDDGPSNWLDVYRHRSHPTEAPTLIHLHGGRFRWGKEEPRGPTPPASPGRPGLDVHQRQLPPQSRHPAPGSRSTSIDVKRVIAWARTAVASTASIPTTIFLAGCSAGAHLTAMAALTAQRPDVPTRLRGRRTRPSPQVLVSPATTEHSTTTRRPSRPLPSPTSGRRAADPRRPRRQRHLHPDQLRRPGARRAPARATSPTRWCSPSSPVASTPSTCSTRSVSRPSSTPSRRSPHGCDPNASFASLAWRWWLCVSWSSSTGRRSARAATPASPHEATSRRGSPHSG